jgi:NADP-dependent 3-hydroxy acid dehydrogenase YdfG
VDDVAYHATKAGIDLLSQQLRVDLYGTGLRVTEVSPGRVATNIFGNPDVAYDQTARFVGQFETLQPEDISEAIAFAVGSPAHMNVAMLEIVPTFQVVGELNFASRSGAAQGPGGGEGGPNEDWSERCLNLRTASKA